MRARSATSLAALAALVAAPVIFLNTPAGAAELGSSPMSHGHHGHDGRGGGDRCGGNGGKADPQDTQKLNNYNGPQGSGDAALHTCPVAGQVFYGTSPNRKACEKLGERRQDHGDSSGHTCVRRGTYGAYDLYELNPNPASNETSPNTGTGSSSTTATPAPTTSPLPSVL
jgi:hypothetical protein